MTGQFSASKKSAERRWLSRCSSLVSALAVWIVTDTFESRGFSAIWTEPAKSENRPRTFETIRCRTAKPTWL
jgi:anti-sigma factor RsiW